MPTHRIPLPIRVEWDGWEWCPHGAVAVFIALRNSPDAGRLFACLAGAALLVSLAVLRLVPKNGFSHLDDYDYPSYVTANSSTNAIAVHERPDLCPRRAREWVLFADGRVGWMSTTELSARLDAQAAEVAAVRGSQVQP
jgi:hypothetical protein